MKNHFISLREKLSTVDKSEGLKKAIERGECAIKSIDETYQVAKMHASSGMNTPEGDPYKEDRAVLAESIAKMKEALADK